MKNTKKIILMLCFAVTLFLRTEGTPAGTCRKLTHQDAPQNGGLVCVDFLQHTFCSVRCNDGFEHPSRVKIEFCGPDTGYTWTYRKDDSFATFDPCVPEFIPDIQFEVDAFYLPGVCDELSLGMEHTAVEAFTQTVVPEALRDLTYTGELICPGRARPTACNYLTSAEAPQNGALVCYTQQDKKYCATRCNKGFEFVSRDNPLGFCSQETGFKWGFNFLDELKTPCVETFWPGLQLQESTLYLPQTCGQLTSQMQTKVKEDFRRILEARDVRAVSTGGISITCGENV